jgi:tetratricopeptide (TPR) repeat protein
MKKSLILMTFLMVLAVMSYGQTAADHIKAGEEAYVQFDDQKALEHYLEALKIEPNNYEALWKTSRAYVDIADVMPAGDKDAKQRQKLYTDATAYAQKAVVANPNDTWGHFQVAASLGKKLLKIGRASCRERV